MDARQREGDAEEDELVERQVGVLEKQQCAPEQIEPERIEPAYRQTHKLRVKMEQNAWENL